jgi:hypothetical protein
MPLIIQTLLPSPPQNRTNSKKTAGYRQYPNCYRNCDFTYCQHAAPYLHLDMDADYFSIIADIRPTTLMQVKQLTINSTSMNQ